MSRRQPTSRSCFVCGRENPVGLKVHWDQDAERQEIRSTVTLPDHFNGYPGVAHGGVVAAVLDETAGRSILVDGGFDDLMVTAKLEVVYCRPTPTGVPLLAVGRLLRRAGSRAEAEAELRLPDGTVTARATVLLARPPEEIKARWSEERPYWKVDEEA
jgi:acyl-coenzyme A thioesterase PaaI-like protein